MLLYEQCGKGCLPLWEALTEQGAQAVICVHVFPAMMMTELSGRGLYLPSYFVATDYTCSPGVSELVVDGICIPHPLLAEEFAAAGPTMWSFTRTGSIPRGSPSRRSSPRPRIGKPSA